MIKKINLNYDWYFKENYELGDALVGGLEKYQKVCLPHTNKEVPLNNFDESISWIISSYKRIITINDLSKEYHLVFEGVGHSANLYINGKFVEEHNCGYTRWEIDITPYIVKGDNEVFVQVDSRETNQPPFGFVIDYLCFGGIYRECYLNIFNKEHFEDHYFHYDEENFYLDYKTNCNDGDIHITLHKDGRQVCSRKFKNGDKIVSKLPKVQLWSIEKPYLYDLSIKLVKNGKVVDEINERVGFRKAEFREDGFYLNDKKVKIRGLNRHQSYPYVGYAMPKRVQEADAIMLKEELCVNAVRTSHYPQSPIFLDKCDELGLLVFEELPGWQHIGNEEWQNQAIQNVHDMIVRDRHHPSIILWGVRINESKDSHNFYIKTNAKAHELDPYRQTGGVRCSLHSELLEDVYTYNDFICSNKEFDLRRKTEVTTSKKPYLVTEYGGHMYPTKSFDNENRRADVALIHSRVLNASSLDDKISGTFGWCFADYNTHRDFGSGDLICYHGVYDIFRNPKFSSYPYRTFGKDSFLEVTSNFNIGENKGGYIRSVTIHTNCDQVKMYKGNELIHTFDIDTSSVAAKNFLLKDLIGNILIKKEKKAEVEALRIKKIIEDLLLVDGIQTTALKRKYGTEAVEEAWEYFGKYVANWGGHPIPYTFKGYKNGKLVKEIIKGPQSKPELKISVDTTTLNTKDSYDVARITLELVGEYGNRYDYANDAFVVKCSRGIEVIGDDIVSLIGGIRTIYVKSTFRTGEAKVTICSPRFGEKTITFNIEE